MKKALVLIVVVVILSWLGLNTAAGVRKNQAAEVPWPSDLGRLQDMPKRFPPAAQNANATRLVELAAAADVELRPRTKNVSPKSSGSSAIAMRKALGDYTKVQLERTGDAIDAPPPAVAAYLATHDAAMSAVRDHLLRGQPIVWETNVTAGFDAPIPNLIGHMHLHRLFTARALEKARRNDPAAWEELRASWELNRGLWPRADLLSVLIATASGRMTNAAARKMPLPAPAWLAETFSYDYVSAMATAQQADAWTIQNAPALRRSVIDVLGTPLYVYEEAKALDTLQKYTAEAVRSKACDAHGPRFAAARASLVTTHAAVPNLIEAWHRLMRFRAELEATERVLQLRAGRTPSTKSQCSDGAWQLTANGFRFSRDITLPPDGLRFPLEYER